MASCESAVPGSIFDRTDPESVFQMEGEQFVPLLSAWLEKRLYHADPSVGLKIVFQKCLMISSNSFEITLIFKFLIFGMEKILK